MSIQDNLKRGTAEMIILNLLLKEEMYGYQLTQEICNRSDGLYIIMEGTLYPILYRLVDKGYVSDYHTEVYKRIRKYYYIEDKGKEYYQSLLREYKAISKGIVNILGADELV
ncbi:MAG: PadR family transcriptional regulator [Oscillospiraceae bacterium]|nr:PadR family transcriptional regulator [Oscillospiraceae bacterium]